MTIRQNIPYTSVISWNNSSAMTTRRYLPFPTQISYLDLLATHTWQLAGTICWTNNMVVGDVTLSAGKVMDALLKKYVYNSSQLLFVDNFHCLFLCLIVSPYWELRKILLTAFQRNNFWILIPLLIKVHFREPEPFMKIKHINCHAFIYLQKPKTSRHDQLRFYSDSATNGRKIILLLRHQSKHDVLDDLSTVSCLVYGRKFESEMQGKREEKRFNLKREVHRF